MHIIIINLPLIINYNPKLNFNSETIKNVRVLNNTMLHNL